MHVAEHLRRGEIGPHGTEGNDQVPAGEDGKAQSPGQFADSHDGPVQDRDQGDEQHHPRSQLIRSQLIGVPENSQADGGNKHEGHQATDREAAHGATWW